MHKEGRRRRESFLCILTYNYVCVYGDIEGKGNFPHFHLSLLTKDVLLLAKGNEWTTHYCFVAFLFVRRKTHINFLYVPTTLNDKFSLISHHHRNHPTKNKFPHF